MRLFPLLFTCFIVHFASAQPQLLTPIAGEVGEDFIIVNYVDWGTGSGVWDHACLSKSYDGHQGTDFVLKSFRQMDAGVNVLAADSGVVIFTHDGEFDREKNSVISKGLGNYIGITHSGNYQTYYGHLKKHSLLVEVGDTVQAGEVIAQVASSGNSTDPHLHFELWYDSTYYIDPYSGPCGNANSYWLDPLPFDSSFNLWHSATWNGIPFLDTVREAPLQVDTVSRIDTAMSYWALLHGLRTGDTLIVEWEHEQAGLWAEESFALDRDWWYYYFYSYILVNDTMPSGNWEVRLFRNGTAVEARSIYLKERKPSALQAPNAREIVFRQMNGQLWVERDEPSYFELYTVSGKLVGKGTVSRSTPIVTDRLGTGVYVVRVFDGDTTHTRLVLF